MQNTTENDRKPDNSAGCAVADLFGNSRTARVARIKHAESLGYKRCEPYACIGVKRPRWYWQGGYYDFDELPSLPNTKLRGAQSPEAQGGAFAP